MICMIIDKITTDNIAMTLSIFSNHNVPLEATRKYINTKTQPYESHQME